MERLEHVEVREGGRCVTNIRVVSADRHYLSEIARVLSPGAKCVITYFLSDSKNRPPSHSVSDVCEVHDLDFPEHGVFYLERFVMTELYEKHGLQIVTLIPGAGRGKPTSNPNPQDIVIAIKPD